jgi:opacity protein-like surface antigen
MVSVAPAAAAEAVVNPGPFDAPPAFPQVYSGPPVAPGEPLKAPPAYATTKIYDWTGFYIGVNGGGALGNADWSSVPDLTSGTLDVSGGLVGGTVGYNLQTGEPWVLGIELDVDWSRLRGTASPTSCAPGCQLNVSWLDTARVRFGWTFDGFVPGGILPYVTAGVALSDLRASIIGTPFGRKTKRTLHGLPAPVSSSSLPVRCEPRSNICSSIRGRLPATPRAAAVRSCSTISTVTSFGQDSIIDFG